MNRRRLLQTGVAVGTGLFATAGAAEEPSTGGFIDANPIDARPLDGEEPGWTLYRTAENLGSMDTDNRALKVGLYDDQVNRTFITYMGANGDAPAYVQAFYHSNDKWTPPIKVGDSFDDSHNYPTIVQGNDGRLHVFHGCHNSPLRHATPADPHTVRGEWTDKAIKEAGGASYPMPFVVSNGDIYVFYRETYVLGEDPDDEEYDTAYRPLRYVRSTDGGETWINSVALTGHEGAINDGRRDNWMNEIYAEQLHVEPAGNDNPERVHFTWMISGGLNENGEHSHGEYLQNVYYAHFTPHNLHWHTADGKDLGQSITPEEMDEYCIVENTLEDDKFTRKHSVVFDKWVHVTADGYPVLLYCLRAPEDMEPGWNFGRIATWTGSEWKKSTLADYTYPGYGLERTGPQTFRYYAGGGYTIDLYEVNAASAGADKQVGSKVDEISYPSEVTADSGLIDTYRDPARLIALTDKKPADIYVSGKPTGYRKPVPGPDLTIDGRTFTVESAGDQIWKITFSVANVGTEPSSSTSAALLNVINGEQIRLATFDVFTLDPNEFTTLTYDWDISMVSAGRYELQVVVDPDDEVRESTETNNDSPTAEITVAKPPTSDTYLSELPWVNATIGWGEIGLDESVGDNPISIGGTTYEKGIGTHASSEITYNLGGNMSHFVADVGVDDETGDNGSVGFRVIGDGEKLAETDILTGSDSATHLDLDVSDVEMLDLVVTDGGDSISYDHADWAAAQVLK